MGFEYTLEYRINPFLLSGILFGVLLYFQCKRSKVSSISWISSNIASNIVLILFTTSLISFVILELFYHEKCPVDPLRYNQTLQIFTIELTALKHMKIDHVAYFGTLLYVLRNTLFAVWDQDSDIAVVKPKEPLKFVDLLSNAISNISMEYKVVYYPKRDLIQVIKDRSHGDIWFYELKNITSKSKDNLNKNVKHKILTNYDYTISHPIIDYNVLFPSHSMKWFGIEVPVPNKEKLAALIEFGDDYMIPRYHRIQCLENIITNKISMNRSIAYIIILIIGNFIAISIKNMLNNKEYFGIIKRNATAVIIATIPTKIIDLFMKTFNNDTRAVILPQDANDSEEKILLASTHDPQ